jgi:transposase
VVISVGDWAEIRRLHRTEQMPVRAIARKLGIARNTVRRAVADDAPPKYQRAPKGSIVDAVEPRIRELLEQWPEMPATVIAERIGWDRGLTVLEDRVRDLRPARGPRGRAATPRPPTPDPDRPGARRKKPSHMARSIVCVGGDRRATGAG